MFETEIYDKLKVDDAFLWYATWWSEKYNRPLKDPLLQSYSIEELIYEYCVFSAKEKLINDIKKEKEEQEELASRKEADEFAKQFGFDEEDNEESEDNNSNNPSDSNNISKEDEEWMNKVIKEEGILDLPDELNIDF